MLGSSSCIKPTSPVHSPTLKSSIDSLYLAKGEAVTQAVASLLASELLAQLQENGKREALRYCSLKAYPLTDSIATMHKAFVKRTSHRVRNSWNKADSLERQIIQEYREAGNATRPHLRYIGDSLVRYFSPIYLAQPCLQCHGGIEEEIGKADYQIIQTLYPQDQATAFKAGEFRGIWSVSFVPE